MDKLKLGALERGGDVHFTTCQVNGTAVPALELRMEGPVDQALLEALQQNDLEIYGADGAKQGEYAGYHQVIGKSVVVAKVTDAQQELAGLKEKLAALQRELEKKSS